MIPYLQAARHSQIGIIGFCWGAKMALNAATSSAIAASGLLHPSRIEADEIDRASGPVLLLPAGNDPDMLPFLAQLKAKPFADLCGHRRYEEQLHGWTVRYAESCTCYVVDLCHVGDQCIFSCNVV